MVVAHCTKEQKVADQLVDDIISERDPLFAYTHTTKKGFEGRLVQQYKNANQEWRKGSFDTSKQLRKH